MRSLRTPSALAATALLIVVAVLSSCGKGSNQGATPTSPSTPLPVAGTPPPTAQPTPSPSPTPTLQGQTCTRLSPGTGSDSSCRTEGGRAYEDSLERAVASVHPEDMNGNEILSFNGYKTDIVRALDQDGICAVFEADNLFMRAVDDDFNEYYDLITSTGDTARRYTNTCRPPVPTPVPAGPPPVRDPTCRLPASIDTICKDSDVQYFRDEVYAAIEAVIAEDRARPVSTVFDFSQAPRGGDGYYVKDITLYHDEVIKKLRGMGFCAWFDEEEIQVKNSNDFSAHWDIYKAEGYRIQLYGGICRDAAF